MALAGSQPLRAAPTAATTTPFLKTAPSLLMTVISGLGAVFAFLIATMGGTVFIKIAVFIVFSRTNLCHIRKYVLFCKVLDSNDEYDTDHNGF